MLLHQPIKDVFTQLEQALTQLSDKEYMAPSKVLFNATIGQHVRHIIELFQCLEKGYDEGSVNYEKRKRDYRIETKKDLAIFLLQRIVGNMNKPNKDLCLETEDYQEEVMTVTIVSNYYRELAYNLEHTIHHMALVRVGVNDVSDIRLPDAFGVAYSTIKYRQQCAQ
jgi:hypothetical protein